MNITETEVLLLTMAVRMSKKRPYPQRLIDAANGGEEKLLLDRLKGAFLLECEESGGPQGWEFRITEEGWNLLGEKGFAKVADKGAKIIEKG